MIKIKKLLQEAGLWNPPEETDDTGGIPDLRTLAKGSKRRNYNAARKWIDTKMKNKSPRSRDYARDYMIWKAGGGSGSEPNGRGVHDAVSTKATLDGIFK